MAESKAITDNLCNEILEPRTVLITNITPALEFDTPVQFFEDLKRLMGYKKRRTASTYQHILNDIQQEQQPTAPD